MLNFYDKYESKISREKFYNTAEKNYSSNSNINPVKKHRFKTIKTNDLLKTSIGGGGCVSGGGGGGGVGMCGAHEESKIKNAKSKSCVDTSKPGVGAYLPYTSSGK